MKLFGAIKELVSAVFRKDSNEITLRPNQSTTYTAARDIQLPPGNTDHVVVSATSTQTLTNKTFDADGTGNSITNIENADIKSGAAIDAAKLADGSVSNTEFQYIGGLTSDAQTQLNAKLDDFSSSNDNRVVRTDGTGGSAVQESPLILSDAGALSGITQLDADNVRIDGNTVSSTSGDLNLNAGANVVNLEGANVFLRAGADLSFYDNDNTNAITISVPADVTANRTPQIPDDTGNFVLTSATQTLTNKTLTSPAINTPTGITKSDVGLSNVDNTSNATERAATATLTNKTLTAPILDDYFDVNEEAAPGTPASGKVRVYAKSDKKLYTKDSSGVEQEIGSGSSSGNVSFFFDDLENGSAANWTGYADAAAATPVDGTGGTATTLTVTASSSSPLREVFSLSVAKSAANGQGQGIAAAVTIPSGYQQAAKRVIEFLWDGSGAGYVAGDMACYIYDVTNSLLITPSVTALPAAKVPIQISWDSSSSASYRLIFHVATTNASAYTVKLDDITVGPGTIVNAAPIGPWIAYTPIISSSGGSVTLNATGKQDPSGFYRQVGDSAEIQINFRNGTGGAATGSAGNIRFTLPTGLTANTAVMAENTNLGRVVGSFSLYNGTTFDDQNIVVFNSGFFNIVESGTSDFLTLADIVAFYSGYILARVPIAEWAGAPNYAGSNDVEYASNNGTWAADNTGATTVYGPAGVAMGGAIGAWRSKTVNWLTPIQADTDIQVEIAKVGTDRWVNANEFFESSSLLVSKSLDSSGSIGASSGIYVEHPTATSTTVQFARYAAIANDDSPLIEWQSTWKWRVRKSRAGAAVGFGAATATSMGLLQPPTSIENVKATQMGLKSYAHGTTYNGGNAPTITLTNGGGVLSSVDSSYFVPYQMQDGSWRLRGNFTVTLDSQTRTTAQLTVNGVTFAVSQAISATSTATAATISRMRSNNASGALDVLHSSATTTTYYFSFDVVLASKPTWAY
jgi:hypothetical protein